MIIPREMRLIIPQGSKLYYGFQVHSTDDIVAAIAQVRNNPADDDGSNDPVLDMQDADSNAWITIDNTSATLKLVTLEVPKTTIEAIPASSNSDGLGYYWDLAVTFDTLGGPFVLFRGRAPIIKSVSRT